MLKQTIIFTALPNGIDGPLAAGSKLHLSVFISPRLWNDDASVKKMLLNQFPDFLDLPSQIAQAKWQVAFEGGPTLNATPENVELRSDLWKALFKDDTEVIPFTFDDYSNVPIDTFPSAEIHDFIRGIYHRVATEPANGAGSNLPTIGNLARDPGLKAISDQPRPEPPYVPPPKDRKPANLGGAPTPTPTPTPGAGGCGCLAWLVSIIRAILHLFGLGIFGAVERGSAQDPKPSAKTVEAMSGEVMATGATKAAFTQMRNFVAPFSATTVPVTQEEYDFHKMVSLLGDYPKLLRYLGLVVDLQVPFDIAIPNPNATIKIIPTLALGTTTTFASPRTHYVLEDNRFVAQPRPADPDISNGLLRLNVANKFRVTQVEIVGTGVKVQNAANNFQMMEQLLKPLPPNIDEEQGLPALQTQGISIIRPELANEYQLTFKKQLALHKMVAALDGEPVLASAPPVPAEDELFAEDLVRGYRIDVFDDKSKVWHSLCRRVGTYKFLDGSITLNDEEDEGFIQPSATQPVKGTAAQRLRVHESLVTWNGWSLVAPRPGKTLLVDGTTGDAPNTAVTAFKLETSFKAKPTSLPRLRYGYSYRLRARVADLAGNSVFDPDDAAFANDVPERTDDFKFTRFEPVSPPALMLRDVPTEGESLERLVVRSEFDDTAQNFASKHPAFTYPTERHVLAPKVSQVMAEQHGEFDGAPKMKDDAAGYALAAREAGSLTQRMNLTTKSLELIDGVKDVKDAALHKDLWLQTKTDFEISYLPDPFAHGALLLALPGMPTPETVIDPSIKIVNKIPFVGNWPDPKPFRLRVVGIDASATPKEPHWDAGTRVLTIELPQAQVVDVPFSSFLDKDELEKMGVWGWTIQPAPPNLAQIEKDTRDGRNWLLMPLRKMTLVHAVQQPLLIPKIATLTPDKKLGDTSASLTGAIALDSKSTGKFDVYAAWSDPFDDVSKPLFDATTDVVNHTAHVAEVLVDLGNDNAPLRSTINNATKEFVVHNFGDTKYHRVTYTPTAATRFREYFPESITKVPDNITRPTQAETADTQMIDILNSARPAAPKILYVVPTFGWQFDPGNTQTKMKRTRVGRGLRVYLERPWFSSGWGELLGVVFLPGTPFTQIGEHLKPLVTQWGIDPIWRASSPALIPDKPNFVNLKDLKTDATLDEYAGVQVGVAGFEVEFDEARGLWFSDIELNLGDSYFPFVRLALARFQPKSVDDAHLSRVVRADFAQLAPDRSASIAVKPAAGKTEIEVRVEGATFMESSATMVGPGRLVELSIEKRDPKIASDLGWDKINSTTQGFSAAPPVLFHGVVTFNESLVSKQYRLVVKEYEYYRTDFAPDSNDKGVSTDKRLVYADVTVLE